MHKSSLLCVLAMVLIGCSAPKPQPPGRAGPTGVPLAHAFPAPGMYRIDTAHSELRVLVYRAGAFANLGHNHVMVNRSMSGSIQVGDAAATSSLTLTLPVASFVVDDARARNEEGAEFPGEIPEEAKTGTLHNMLSSAVLDAAAHPFIAISSLTFTDTVEGYTANVKVGVAGHESVFATPFALTMDAGQLRATGTVDLHQTSLGLTPYSLMLGALQVQDALKIKFTFAAIKEGA